MPRKYKGKISHKDIVLYLDGGCVDFELLEDGKSLLKELIIDGDVGNVWGVIVV